MQQNCQQIVVELDDCIEFVQEVEIPNLPKFCPHCKTLGHALHECKDLQRAIREDERTKSGNDNRWKATNKRNYNGEVGTIGTKDHLDQEIFIQSGFDKAIKTTETTKEVEIERPNITEKGLHLVVRQTTTQDMEKNVVGFKVKVTVLT
ncbi:hypothetical protein FRX31_030749 [Thalictrum thalictroides]|uniref:Uncharacterized protein n=1 Tax=Thalictrum thalictroides TaxID=46969 RepID=A0A7J6V4E7_THATH|nr:hypothetical protein FRX31_030749 [Thalictrum thalictroides]